MTDMNQIHFDKISKNKNQLGRWTLVQQIGKGGTSKVYLGKDMLTGEKAAIKVFTSSRSLSRKLLKSESGFLKQLCHNNVAKFLEAYESIEYLDPDSGTIVETSVFVVEWVPKGELFDLIDNLQNLTEERARLYFQQLINALDYIHKKDIVHHDIKLDNILIDANDSIKVIDFGYAASTKNQKFFYHGVGTFIYFTPEAHARTSYDGQAADLFAAGIILFAMMTGHMPFSKATPEDRYYTLFFSKELDFFWQLHEYKMKRKDPNFCFSSEFKDLLSKMLSVNPKQRLTIKEIVSHPWMQMRSSSCVFDIS